MHGSRILAPTGTAGAGAADGSWLTYARSLVGAGNRAGAAARAAEWAIPAEREEDVSKGRALLYDYHQFWKGDPDVMVVEDKDGPLIEREWQVEIPGCPLPFTCRPDAVVE